MVTVLSNVDVGVAELVGSKEGVNVGGGVTVREKVALRDVDSVSKCECVGVGIGVIVFVGAGVTVAVSVGVGGGVMVNVSVKVGSRDAL